MKKHDHASIPYLPYNHDFFGFDREPDCFDPFGSYTGRTKERDEIPVQDADDL